MANLPKSVVAFAGNNTKTYEQFKDYYFHFQANNPKLIMSFNWFIISIKLDRVVSLTTSTVSSAFLVDGLPAFFTSSAILYSPILCTKGQFPTP